MNRHVSGLTRVAVDDPMNYVARLSGPEKKIYAYEHGQDNKFWLNAVPPLCILQKIQYENSPKDWAFREAGLQTCMRSKNDLANLDRCIGYIFSAEHSMWKQCASHCAVAHSNSVQFHMQCKSFRQQTLMYVNWMPRTSNGSNFVASHRAEREGKKFMALNLPLALQGTAKLQCGSILVISFSSEQYHSWIERSTNARWGLQTSLSKLVAKLGKLDMSMRWRRLLLFHFWGNYWQNNKSTSLANQI